MTDNLDQRFARPFADFLQEQTAHGELTDQLHALIEAVRDTGKAGTLTYTVKVEQLKDDETMLRITDKIAAKLPEHDRPKRLYWVDAHGNPTRENPHQPAFEGLQVLEDPEPARPQPITDQKEA